MIASVYWFAAQALTAAFGVQALMMALADVRPSLVPTALAIALVQAAIAALGFDVMRWLLRIVLPLSVATAGVLLGVWLMADEPEYGVGRVLESPDQNLTWVGFATVVTVMCGSSLTLVTNIADLTRYTRSRRDMRRSHHALTAPAQAACPRCHEPRLPHRGSGQVHFSSGNPAASVTRSKNERVVV